MHYVGGGNGDYMAQSTYKYVGYGGDFSNVRRRRDFTCLICTALISMLLLLLAWWWLWPVDECFEDQQDWQYKWGQSCCSCLRGGGCGQLTSASRTSRIGSTSGARRGRSVAARES